MAGRIADSPSEDSKRSIIQSRARSTARRRNAAAPGSRSHVFSRRSTPRKTAFQARSPGATRPAGDAGPWSARANNSDTPRDAGSGTTTLLAYRIDSGTKIVRDQLDMS